LSRRDLEPAIGGRGRVSEILNRKRPLTLPMIRSLSALLDLPAELLIKEYPTASAARGTRPCPCACDIRYISRSAKHLEPEEE